MKNLTLAFVISLSPFVLMGNTVACTAADSDVIFVDEGEEGNGWLGVSIQDMTSRLASSMNVKTKDGALVNEVVEDSPAEKAGVKKKDIIVSFGGKTIDDADDLFGAVRKTKPGAKVSVTVMRKDEKVELSATVDKAPEERALSWTPKPPHPPKAPRVMTFHRGEASHGLSMKELNEQLAEYFEAPNKRGVLVENVKKESAAEKAGFKAGDVIIKAGKQSVEDIHDVLSELSRHEKGEKVEIEVVRKGSRKVMSLEVQGASSQWLGGPHGFHWEYDDDFNFDFEFDSEGMEQMKLELKKIKPELDKLRLELKDGAKDLKEKVLMLQRKTAEV